MHDKDRRRQTDTQVGDAETVREDDGFLDSRYLTERAKVPGGWLVIAQFKIGGSHGLTFLPDPNHQWDGGTLP